MVTPSFRRGVTTTPTQKNLLMSLYLQLWSLTVKLALEFISIVSEALVVDTLRTVATNNNFGEFAVNDLSIKWILVTKVQSRNLLEKLQQHPQCMMVWLNLTSIDFQQSGTDLWCFKVMQLQAFCGVIYIFFLVWDRHQRVQKKKRKKLK